MTDPMDDLRQATDLPLPPDSDLAAAEAEELMLLCGHAPGPEPLSPAAQAVLDAIYEIKDPMGEDGSVIAAALRAAVDQSIPLTKTPWGTTLIPVLNAQESRNRLLAIADELEASQG